MNFAFLADRPDAIPIIAKWYFNEWGYLRDVNSIEKTIQILQQYLNRDKIPLILLAIENDEIAGAVQLKYYEMDLYPEKEHWLGGVYVSDKYRKKKIAEKLVNRAIEVATNNNVETLYLQTEKLDGGLYKRLGWKPIDKVKYNGKEVLVMKKKL